MNVLADSSLHPERWCWSVGITHDEHDELSNRSQMMFRLLDSEFIVMRGSELILVLFGLALMLPLRPEKMCRHSTVDNVQRAQYLQRKLAAVRRREYGKTGDEAAVEVTAAWPGSPKFFLDSSINGQIRTML